MTDNRVYEHGTDGRDWRTNLVHRVAHGAGLLHSSSFPSHDPLHCARACNDPSSVPLEWWQGRTFTSAESPLTSTCTRFSVQPVPSGDGSFACILYPGVWEPAEGDHHTAHFSSTGGSKTYHRPYTGSWATAVVGAGLCRTSATADSATSPYYEDRTLASNDAVLCRNYCVNSYSSRRLGGYSVGDGANPQRAIIALS